MGYFSNGTAGEIYMCKWCQNCAHLDDPCMVWGAHLSRNYEDCNDENSILHLLIPRSEDKLSNKQCTMFIKSNGEPKTDYIPLKGEVVTLP